MLSYYCIFGAMYASRALIRDCEYQHLLRQPCLTIRIIRMRFVFPSENNPEIYMNKLIQIFKASVPDIRPFANLLRGICFSNANQRASMTINNSGFVVFVEESRVLLGK